MYDKTQQIHKDIWGNAREKKAEYWSLRLTGVKAHSRHNCCQLFAKIYDPKGKVFKETVRVGG